MGWRALHGCIAAAAMVTLACERGDREEPSALGEQGAGTSAAGGGTAVTDPRGDAVKVEAWGPADRAEAGAGQDGTPERAAAQPQMVGQVESITEDELTLEGGRTVRITSETEFLRDGRSVPSGQVRPGAAVRAAYDDRGNGAHATRVELLDAGSGADAGPGAVPAR